MRVALLVAAFAATTPSFAEEGPTEEARAHFEEAAKHYKLGEYAEAVDEYKRSYELYPAPLLLYDLGQAYRKLGEWNLALHSYQQYLADAPPSSAHRHDATVQVAELQILIKEQRARQTAPPDGVADPERPTVAGPELISPKAEQTPLEPTPAAVMTPTPEPKRVRTNGAGWAALSLSLLAIAAGATSGALLIHATGIDPNARQYSIQMREDLSSQVNNEETAGIAVGAVGAAALIAGAACLGVWIYRHHHPEPAVRADALVLKKLVAVGGPP